MIHGAMGMAMGSIGGIMASMPLPPGYSWSFGRWNRMGQRDQEGSNFALLFALILVYMLMAALFESFSHPFAIMMAVPFAFIGVGVVMKLAAQPRDNFTELGFIVLVGVVVTQPPLCWWTTSIVCARRACAGETPFCKGDGIACGPF